MKYLVKDPYFPQCPIRNVLSHIADKWSLLVIYELNKEEKMRFGILKKQIPDISQKMLTSTLRTLEMDGYVFRKAYAEVPPRVEYRLTERAKSLLPIIEQLIDWASHNMSAIMRDRQRFIV